jgi:WD40 repeat protein
MPKLQQTGAQPGARFVRRWGYWLIILVAAGCGGSNDGGSPSSGSQVTFLTSTAGIVDYWPRFSPNGSLVLFSRQDNPPNGSYKFWTVPSGGGTASLFVHPPTSISETRANWLWTDSMQIAFTGDSMMSASLWLVNADGSGAQAVPNAGTMANAYPSWLPGGTSVMVTASETQNPGPALRRIGVPGGTPTGFFTDPYVVMAGEPAVSHDGLTVAFAGQRAECDFTAQPVTCQNYNDLYNQIWVELAFQDGAAEVHHLDPDQGRTPDWSPDDVWLAFESSRGCTGGNYAIFVEVATGGEAIQVTDCSLNANHGVWSPDGKQIAFSAVLPNEPLSRGIAIAPVPPLPTGH